MAPEHDEKMNASRLGHEADSMQQTRREAGIGEQAMSANQGQHPVVAADRSVAAGDNKISYTGAAGDDEDEGGLTESIPNDILEAVNSFDGSAVGSDSEANRSYKATDRDASAAMANAAIADEFAAEDDADYGLSAAATV